MSIGKCKIRKKYNVFYFVFEENTSAKAGKDGICMKKGFRKTLVYSLLALLFTGFCVMPAQARTPKLNKTKLSMRVGQKKTLKVKNTKKKVIWKSSKPKIVKVSKKGVLTAKKPGKATVKAKAGRKTLKCHVTVKKEVCIYRKPSGECQVKGGFSYVRTDGSRKGAKYPGGVLISTKAELEKYYQENRQYYAMDGSFRKTIKSFDDAYFKKNKLVVLVLRTGSGSDRYRVVSVDYNNQKKEYQAEVELIPADVGTCDIAVWHILLPVTGRIPKDSNVKVKVSRNPEANAFEKAMERAVLKDDGKSFRSLAEYQGIRTLTNGFTAKQAGNFGKQEFSGMRKFSYNLFHQAVAGVKEKNPVISPISAYFVLSMAAAGSGGETRKQFADVLGMTESQLEKNAACGQLKRHLSSVGNATVLNIANSIWTDQDFSVSGEYLQNIVNYFDSEVYSGRMDSDEMKNAINQWGSEKTNGLIDQLLDENFSPDVVLNLLNAVYLNAEWAKPFEAGDTRERIFYREDGTQIRTKFLHSERMLDYIETDNAQGAVLPYKDGKTVFLALRPTDGSRVREFAGKLDQAAVKEYLCNARQAKFDFYMPVLETECKIEMNEVLKNMGLVRAFDSMRADFSKIPEKADVQLWIDRVFQKVKVKVNEKGTEAAAITDISMKAESAPWGLKVIRTLDLNSPYVYVIVDLASQTPLFTGVVEEPAAGR